MKTRNGKRYIALKRNRLALIGVLVLTAVSVSLYSASSSSRAANQKSKPRSQPVGVESGRSLTALPLPGLSKSRLFAAAPFSAESIATYDSTCTTPQDSFNLGDTVCAIVTNAPLAFNGRDQRRIAWVSPYGAVTQGGLVTTNPQQTTYTVPTTQTQEFSENRGNTVVTYTVDNRGTWNVGLYANSDGSRIVTAFFTVHDPQNPFVDQEVNQFSSADTVNAGDSNKFSISVSNRGPDAAQNVVLTDVVPNDTTLVAIAQTSGSAFSCTGVAPGGTGTITCTIASLARGASASFDLAYNVNGTATPGEVITNNATISSDTSELVPDDNSSSASVTVSNTGGGGSTCSVACPDDITVPANTVDQNNNPGATVHFSAPSGNDECGTISVNHCNDCFFPVGSTVVTATGTGDSCSFTVTVTSSGLSITCPSNKTANAGNDCQATVDAGTASATGGENVTITATRSDGKPMYDCDVNGNCVRKIPDLPFATGITTITWTATSHDSNGNESGNASCTQTVTVNDIAPPVIGAADSTVSADANCQATIPDYSSTVTDNCACASSDTSDACAGHPHISYSQTPAAGTVVGLGAHIVQITANDGSSNNGGAGNTATATVTLTVVDTTPPTFTFVPANVTAYTGPNATTCDAVVDPGTATATDNCGAVTITRSPSGNTFPVGTTTITWTATDGAGNTSTATQAVTVIDNTPPVITVNGNTPSLWPPNHKYQTFGVANFVSSVFDNCGGISVADVVISSVTSDEPENGAGSGDTLNDIVIAADCRSVQLRAEREGGGDGRVYTIAFKVTDTHGNVGTATARVLVPHNPGDAVVDSGVHYTVNGTCP